MGETGSADAPDADKDAPHDWTNDKTDRAKQRGNARKDKVGYKPSRNQLKKKRRVIDSEDSQSEYDYDPTSDDSEDDQCDKRRQPSNKQQREESTDGREQSINDDHKQRGQEKEPERRTKEYPCYFKYTMIDFNIFNLNISDNESFILLELNQFLPILIE